MPACAQSRSALLYCLILQGTKKRRQRLSDNFCCHLSATQHQKRKRLSGCDTVTRNRSKITARRCPQVQSEEAARKSAERSSYACPAPWERTATCVRLFAMAGYISP